MYIGKILDPIHGSIEMTEIEKWIIQQKIFARLRKVKQNTLLNYVFPGANHTRFEHSIGVMHLASEIFEKSNENSKIARLKSEKYDKKENQNFLSVIDLLSDEKEVNVLRQELRLAALLHDVGHGPTSHKFDDFTIKGSDLIKIIKSEPNYFKDYLENFKKYLNKEKKGKSGYVRKIDHELVSCVFIIKLIKELKEEKKFTSESKEIIEKINLKNIIKMIEPDFLEDYEIQIEEENVTDYFNSIISSFPIDADRMDYLYRDSFYSGVKYGFYDLTRILSSVVPTKFEGRITLGIKSSGLDSVIRFIQSRNHLYNQVYFHKTNCATNTMLDFIFRHFKDKSVMEGITDYKSFEEFYWNNSDEYFFNVTLKKILEEGGCETCGDGCIENDVRIELLERKLWKRVYEKRYNVKEYNRIDNKKFDKEKVEKLKIELEKDKIFIDVNYSKNEGLKGFKDSEGQKKSKIVVLDKEDNYTPTCNWEGYNDELSFLNQTNTFIVRIYLRKTFVDAKEYEKRKGKVLGRLTEEGMI